MSDYRFDFTQADATIYDMQTINKRIGEALQGMESSVEKSLADWTGAAQATYWDAKAQWNKSAGDMNAYFEQARLVLMDISDNYGTTEQRHTKLWNDVRGG
ncbi:WXG100 family type VII secretion target [Actinocatenispora comari]|uniref:ESAT-6-like protein n=1 Tax=Actinocatenispora comari TaxID=2807577 RepID=A0A8J4EL03_9ACTN|nr:WXG100 family type VII secretion target [Actinocatenispora comari]GIL27951.1 hypothetical protein NUM_32050 [Actinocatenispora comari]